MTLVNIDLRNQGYETGPDDRVVFYSLLVREGDFGTISTAPVEVELVDGRATVDLAPGPVGVQIVARQVADTRIKIGEVPPSGPTTLNAVMMVTPAYTPALQKMMIAAIERAKEIAVRQVDGAVSMAIDAEVGEAIYTATSSAVSAANSAAASQLSATSADARATVAESKSANAVSRVSALEVVGGLTPGEPADGQTANLIEQPGTLTRGAVTGAVQVGSGAVSVKDFGATGDGTTDDTEAINTAISYASANGLGRVVIPDGVYMIKADDPGGEHRYVYLGDAGGIEMLSGIHLDMAANAVLQAIPTPERRYVVVRVYDKHDVKISGGKIVGDYDVHPGTAGEWGYGIAITGGYNITIDETHCSNFWGDGVNIQWIDDTEWSRPRRSPRNILVRNVTCVDNLRQGMSIEAAQYLRVEGGEYSRNGGKNPQSGIDIEPSVSNIVCQDIVLVDVLFRDNIGAGLQMTMGEDISNVTIERCIFDGNRGEGSTPYQVRYWSGGNNITMRGCEVKNTPVSIDCVYLSSGTNHLVEDCVFDGKFQFGRRTYYPPGSVTLRRNRFHIGAEFVGNAVIAIGPSLHATVEDNYVIAATPRSAQVRGIFAASGESHQMTIRGNRVIGTWRGIDTTVPGPPVYTVESNIVEWTHETGMRLNAPSILTVAGNTVNHSLIGATGTSLFGAVAITASELAIVRGNVLSNIAYPSLPPELVGATSLTTVGIDVASTVTTLVNAGGNVAVKIPQAINDRSVNRPVPPEPEPTP